MSDSSRLRSRGAPQTEKAIRLIHKNASILPSILSTANIISLEYPKNRPKIVDVAKIAPLNKQKKKKKLKSRNMYFSIFSFFN